MAITQTIKTKAAIQNARGDSHSSRVADGNDAVAFRGWVGREAFISEDMRFR